MMLDPGVSEMSCGSHRFLGSRGRLIGPSRMDSEKHSRMMLVSSLKKSVDCPFLKRVICLESHL